jgi:hypothetical protein
MHSSTDWECGKLEPCIRRVVLIAQAAACTQLIGPAFRDRLLPLSLKELNVCGGGRNGKRVVAVRCRRMPDTSKNGGSEEIPVSCHEVPDNARIGCIGGDANRCPKMRGNGKN